MRICMFVSNDMTSDPRVSRHAETLGRMGHEVVVVCPKSPSTSHLEERTSYRVVRCNLFPPARDKMSRRKSVSAPTRNRTYSFPQERPQRLFGRVMREIVASLFRLLLHPTRLTYVFWKAGRKFNAHVYYTNDLDTLLAGVLCSGASRILIHDAHELWPDQFIGMGIYRSPAIAWMRILERLLIRRAEIVFTVNEFIAEVMQKRYRIEKPHVVLNLPAVDPLKPGKTPRKTGSPKVALYQGLYTSQRGLENVIRACEFLENDVVLVLRGSGPTEQQLRAIAKPFGNCSFEAPVKMSETVTAAAQTADVGLVSYLPVNINNYFASPNKLFEYIQAGLPVVSSDLPFLRSIIAGNEIGLLFDPRDPGDIAAKINMATRDAMLAIFRANVNRVQRRYRWDEEQEKLVSLIRRLTHSPKSIETATHPEAYTTSSRLQVES